MKKKIASLLFILALLIVPRFSFAAGYESNICKTTGDAGKCTSLEVGVFMQDISSVCGNTGKCTLCDLMQVGANVGNFTLSIVGGLLLLFYVLGGFWYLASHGDSAWVNKGKTAIKTSTIGLLIIMFAYLGIKTLVGVLAPSQGAGVCGQGVTPASGAPSCADAHPNYSCKSIDPTKDATCITVSGLCAEGGTCCKNN